jgi:hypothetical protein
MDINLHLSGDSRFCTGVYGQARLTYRAYRAYRALFCGSPVCGKGTADLLFPHFPNKTGYTGPQPRDVSITLRPCS